MVVFECGKSGFGGGFVGDVGVVDKFMFCAVECVFNVSGEDEGIEISPPVSLFKYSPDNTSDVLGQCPFVKP